MLTLLALDLGVWHKDQHEIGIRESLWLSLGYVSLIFSYFTVPRIYQHRVLFWGILGALILRAITQDPFVVYTSNIFALAAMVHRFSYLKYALALVLVFIGGKILGHDLIGPLPAAISLSVTFSLIAGGVLISLWKTRADTVV